ncbi:unnamed protein product [Soboliphyme baturini]|uniref:L-glutamate gamma-semialdehyde dehydrogenase n=1 Tax=Soboliphyme baturini TaxID=241478 RepID=A0A183I9R4_9BILA|nr:unnamed protein product [Soboliphyme baturini]
MIDFWRFNSLFAMELEKCQPASASTSKNSTIYRGLEGFVAAISPFNFTAIGGNMCTCPAIMGNTVVWKPARTALLSNYVAFKILREAGLPPGVINFIPTNGPAFGNSVIPSPHLAGISFVGSLPLFQDLWKQVGANIESYINFPRLSGECGGKNFHFVHPSADMDTVAACTIRSAFEYQGQKCSACSRLYVPQSVWPTLRTKLLKIRDEIKMGDVS